MPSNGRWQCAQAQRAGEADRKLAACPCEDAVTHASEEDRPPSTTANNKTRTATAMRDNPDYCSIFITISNSIRIILHSEYHQHSMPELKSKEWI